MIKPRAKFGDTSNVSTGANTLLRTAQCEVRYLTHGDAQISQLTIAFPARQASRRQAGSLLVDHPTNCMYKMALPLQTHCDINSFWTVDSGGISCPITVQTKPTLPRPVISTKATYAVAGSARVSALRLIYEGCRAHVETGLPADGSPVRRVSFFPAGE